MRTVSRASRSVRLARRLTLVGIWMIAIYGCSRMTEEKAPLPVGDDGGVEATPPLFTIDAGEEAAVLADACAAVLLPSATCKHPVVTPSCDGGWCRIPAGCFIMGSPPCEPGRGAYSETQVQVTLTRAFAIKQTEVTQAEWTAEGFPNPSTVRRNDGGLDDGDCSDAACPVGNLSAADAMSYANALSAKAALPSCYALSECTGSPGADLSCARIELTTATTYECLGYRLPTEAEWEYVIRAGTTTQSYAGEFARLKDCDVRDPVMDAIGWYCFNSRRDGGHYSRPVGLKMPNPWGLFDMAGNAYEWTSSNYTGVGYGKGPLVDPMSTLGDGCLDLRGGGANFSAVLGRSAARAICSSDRNARGPLVGARLVRTLP